MNPGIEDNFEDVLAKAARGLGLGAAELAARTGVPAPLVRELMRGEADLDALRPIASALQLSPEALVDLAGNRWCPDAQPVDGLAAFTEAYPVPGYEEMTVNSYVAWDTTTGDAVAFDAGATAAPMIERVSAEGLSLRAVLLTHSHADHVAGLAALKDATGGPSAYLHVNEQHDGAEPLEEGRVFAFGGLSVEVRLTDGHSPGGCTFVISGLDRPVAVVGDSLFCLSQGGTPSSAYAGSLENNRRKVLSLPNDCVLCPGHGPVTTVSFEKAHNPFFAA